MGKDEEATIRRAIGYGDFTGEVLLDPETPLEQLFNLPLIAGCLLLLCSGGYLVLAAFEVVQGGEARAWSLLFSGIVLTPIGVFLRSLVDVHYKLHLDERTITLYRRVFQWRTSRKVGEFSDVECLEIDHSRTRIKDHRYSDETYVDQYRYGLFLLMKNGRRLRILKRAHLDHGLVHERARFVAQHLEVNVRGARQTPQMSRSSGSCSVSGCSKLGGLLLVMMLIHSVVGWFQDKPKSQRVRPGQKAVAVHQTPEPPPSSLALYCHRLRELSFDSWSSLLASGLVDVVTTDSLWKVLHNTPPLSAPVDPPHLSTVLSRSSRVVSSMALKLDLYLGKESESQTARLERWKKHISLRLEIEAEDGAALPILLRNLELGFRRMAMGSPRHGKAFMTLKVSPLAKKPQVIPEEDGFTLVVPAYQPIDPTDLGLTPSGDFPPTFTGNRDVWD